MEILKYYPYIGFFTNNPNDIRGMQFINLLYNNPDKLKELNGDLKNEYIDLLFDGFVFIKSMMKKVSDANYNDFYFQKWLYDFFNGFIDFSKFIEYNVFINYEANTDNIREIVKLLDIEDEVINYIDNNEKNETYITNINNNLNGNIDDGALINLFKTMLNQILVFHINNINKFTNKDDIRLKLRGVPANFSFTKTNQINYFKNNEDNLKLILEINKNLNKKYELYFHIQNNIKDELLDLLMDTNLINSNLDINCFSTYLSMGNKECKDTLLKVIKEDGYGTESKNFFENDLNFVLFEFYFYEDKERKHSKLPNLNLITLLLKKLDFKIKLSPIKFKDISDNIEELPKYIKYYENFDSWSKHQNISKKLSTQSHLKNYLNHFIELINRRVILLNPKLKTFSGFFKSYFGLDINKANIKEKYKKIYKLFEDNYEIPLDKLLISINNYPKNNNAFKFNHMNKIGILMSIIETTGQRNLPFIAQFLNMSYKFDSKFNF